jgi:hypothetical protein
LKRLRRHFRELLPSLPASNVGGSRVSHAIPPSLHLDAQHLWSARGHRRFRTPCDLLIPNHPQQSSPACQSAPNAQLCLTTNNTPQRPKLFGVQTLVCSSNRPYNIPFPILLRSTSCRLPIGGTADCQSALLVKILRLPTPVRALHRTPKSGDSRRTPHMLRIQVLDATRHPTTPAPPPSKAHPTAYQPTTYHSPPPSHRPTPPSSPSPSLSPPAGSSIPPCSISHRDPCPSGQTASRPWPRSSWRTSSP